MRGSIHDGRTSSHTKLWVSNQFQTLSHKSCSCPVWSGTSAEALVKNTVKSHMHDFFFPIFRGALQSDVEGFCSKRTAMQHRAFGLKLDGKL